MDLLLTRECFFAIIKKTESRRIAMKIYDISQELFSSNVYPGDKKPEYIRVSDMIKGAVCNVTELEMNAHNGTHVDAPRHFVRDGKTIEHLEPEIMVGKCTVKTFERDLTADDISSVANVVESNTKRVLLLFSKFSIL